MPKRPTGRNTIIVKASVSEEDDRVARVYAEERNMYKSTVYSQALTWYLDSPESKEPKEQLSDAERRALERSRR
jgi:hypothetical protein